MENKAKTWKLMGENAITSEQKEVLCDFIRNSDWYSQGKNVKEFENAWSAWQGCKYSVFVNSGSSANFLAVHACKNLYSRPGEKSLWCTTASTWCTTLSPILLAGDDVVLCDINLNNFGPDPIDFEKVVEQYRPRFLFLPHLLGFSGWGDHIKTVCNRNGIIVLEDCCESHGAKSIGVGTTVKKVGNIGKVSTFSFYYGHHMTTIEGGMVCTDDEDIYEQLLLLRSHGLKRELPPEFRNRHEEVLPNFTFLIPGFNVRSTELNALLGLQQLKSLDENIHRRNVNLDHYASVLSGDMYIKDWARFQQGVSSFCFPIIPRNLGDVSRVKKSLQENNIEFRPIIGGNLNVHPLCRKSTQVVVRNETDLFHNASLLHNRGLYVGNNHQVTSTDATQLACILNKAAGVK